LPNTAEAERVDDRSGFIRELGTFDSVMIVVGTMIGSGIFIVPAEMARLIGSPGWVLVAWLFAGFLTVSAAISYGELSSMMPEAGGMYIYLREAFSPLWGFLYGWTLFTVIQTGTIAAVAVAFARFTGLLIPGVSESNYLVQPIHVAPGYGHSLRQNRSEPLHRGKNGSACAFDPARHLRRAKCFCYRCQLRPYVESFRTHTDRPGVERDYSVRTGDCGLRLAIGSSFFRRFVA
jgi:hypothetical protein